MEKATRHQRHVRKPNGQISYHLETKTCFSLFDNLDLFSSGCFSRNGAGRFKGEAAIFKTPSTADILILELVTVCCLRFRSQFTSVTKCCGSHRTKSRGTSFLPCPFFYSALRASVAMAFGRASGDVLCASEAMACGY